MTIGAHAMSAFQRVLVPVDFSECSMAALRTAAELTRRTGGRLEVIHVWQLPAFLPPESVVGTVGASGQPLVELVKQGAESAMKELVARAHAENIVIADARVMLGEPARVIVERAASEGHDLIVVGTRGRTGVSRALLGSVAEKVVRLSEVPVLTVRDAGAA